MGKSSQNFAAVTRVGLDLAKSAFQVRAVDAKGEIVVARKLTRGKRDRKPRKKDGAMQTNKV